MTRERLIREKAQDIYQEASLISGTYATGLYASEIDLETVKTQLDYLSVYLNSTIRIINPSGRLILDSDSPINVEEEIRIQKFDPTSTGGSYYMVNNFFDSFDQDVLTVLSPITYNYMVKGYVVIHCDMEQIEAFCNSLLNISYITLFLWCSGCSGSGGCW